MKLTLSLFVFLVAAFACMSSPVVGLITMGIGGAMLAAPSSAVCATLAAPQEILDDIASAFLTRCPLVNTLGGQWMNDGIIPGKKYTAHIASAVAVQDLTTTLFPSPASGTDNLTDLDITASYKKGAPLTFDMLSLAATEKGTGAYNKVIASAASGLANQFMADLWSFVRSEYFTYGATYDPADFDLDALNYAQTVMNGNGAGDGRTAIISSACASVLGQVPGIASSDYFGQRNGAAINRAWGGIAGFNLVQEWAGMTANNGTALTSVAATASTDLFTKTAHGLVTGSRVKVGSGWSASIGITNGTYCYAIYVSSSTFKLASTPALAYAGTALDVALDATGGTITPEENIVGFATDLSGIQFVAGPLDMSKAQEMAQMLGVREIVTHDTVQHESGLVFGAVKCQTLNGAIQWMPTLVYGFRAGRGVNTAAPGAATDKGGLLFRSA